VAMITSYFVGQKYYPLNYPLKSIAIYVIMAVLLTMAMYYVPDTYGFCPILTLAFNIVCICCYVSYILYKDLPLSKLPVIGKLFKGKKVKR